MKEIKNQPGLKNLTWSQICTYIVYTYAPAVNLMNTVLKRPRKFRIAQNCKITQTVQLTWASLQTPFSLSELAYIHAFIYTTWNWSVWPIHPKPCQFIASRNHSLVQRTESKGNSTACKERNCSHVQVDFRPFSRNMLQ